MNTGKYLVLNPFRHLHTPGGFAWMSTSMDVNRTSIMSTVCVFYTSISGSTYLSDCGYEDKSMISVVVFLKPSFIQERIQKCTWDVNHKHWLLQKHNFKIVAPLNVKLQSKKFTFYIFSYFLQHCWWLRTPWRAGLAEQPGRAVLDLWSFSWKVCDTWWDNVSTSQLQLSGTCCKLKVSHTLMDLR